MGYCHKCQHDCTIKDPCPCCRHPYHMPWYSPSNDMPKRPIGKPISCEEGHVYANRKIILPKDYVKVLKGD